jgi:hypothetical protein
LGCGCFLILAAIAFFAFKTPLKKFVNSLPSHENAATTTSNVPSSGGRPSTDLQRPEPSSSRSSSATIRARITVDGVDQASGWEALLFSSDRLERHDRLSSTSTFVWEGLLPGAKTLHVMPARYEDGISSFSLPILVETGRTIDVLVPLVRGVALEGEVADTRGVQQAFLFVQVVQLPVGAILLGPVNSASDEIIEQAASGKPFELVEKSANTRLDRWAPVRAAGYDHLAIGAFTQGSGSFTIKGLSRSWARVQVTNGKELLYDGVQFLDGRKVRLEIPQSEFLVDSNVYVLSSLTRLRFQPFDIEAKRLADAMGTGKDRLLKAMETDANQELSPDRKAGLQRVVSQLRVGSKPK